MPTATATPAQLTPELAAALQEQEARLRGRLTRPESLVKAEEGLAALAKSNIEAQQAEAKTYGEEIRAARDAALARAQRDIKTDPMSLLALAGSMDTRRGQGVGSLARGAATLLGQREAAAEAARKEFAMAQRDERSMQANIRQTQMLEAQRQVALEKGKLDEVNAINDQLSKLAIDRENFRITRGDVAFQQAMKGREVAVEEDKARSARISASKPGEFAQMLQAYQANPSLFKDMFAARSGSEDKLALARQALQEKDVNYKLARMEYINETDPAKKANALRKMREIEALNGIVDAGTAPPATQAPAVGTVMQGYRFKGGNPADKNNWEKV